MLRKLLRPHALCLLGLLLCPAASAARVADRIVAVVNDEIILESDLDQVALPTFRDADPESAEGKRKLEAHRHKVLDTLIEKQLVAQHAKELKIHVSEDEIRRAMDEVKKNNGLDDVQFREALRAQGFSLEGYKKQLKQQLLELKVVNQAVRSKVSVPDEEVRAYYAQTVRQASGDDVQVHLRQILVGVKKGATPTEVEEKRKLGLSLVEQLRAGADFDKLARTYGEDLASRAGGDLGWMARGDLPAELREVVVTMDGNDVRGPVRTERGFHVLQLLEKKEGGVRAFDEVKEQLRRQLYDQQVEKGVQNWTKDLRRKAHVEIRL